jgi:hypothetical protein
VVVRALRQRTPSKTYLDAASAAVVPVDGKVRADWVGRAHDAAVLETAALAVLTVPLPRTADAAGAAVEGVIGERGAERPSLIDAQRLAGGARLAGNEG